MSKEYWVNYDDPGTLHIHPVKILPTREEAEEYLKTSILGLSYLSIEEVDKESLNED